jgi:hypothetical protein
MTTSPGARGRYQALLQIGEEDFAVHGLIDDERSRDAILAQCRHEGRGLPMPMRHIGNEPLSSPTTATKSGHVGGCSGLVNEDEFAGIERWLILFPSLTGPSNVVAILLGGPQTFF